MSTAQEFLIFAALIKVFKEDCACSELSWKRNWMRRPHFFFFQFWPSESPWHPLEVKNCIFHANSSLYYFHTYCQYKVIQVQYIKYISFFSSPIYKIYKCFFLIYSFDTFLWFLYIICFKKSTVQENFQIRVRTWDQTVALISRYQLSATLKYKMSSNGLIRKDCPKTVYSRKISYM